MGASFPSLSSNSVVQDAKKKITEKTEMDGRFSPPFKYSPIFQSREKKKSDTLLFIL